MARWIRVIGTSSFPGHMVVDAQWVAERRGRERPRVEQLAYSVLARGVEADVLPVCARPETAPSTANASAIKANFLHLRNLIRHFPSQE